MRLPRGIRIAVASIGVVVSLQMTACSTPHPAAGPAIAAGPAASSASAITAQPASTLAPTATAHIGNCGVSVSTDIRRVPTVSYTPNHCTVESNSFQRVSIVDGTGAAAGPGQTITIRYVGVAWTTKRAFAISWAPPPLEVTLPAGSLLDWDALLSGARAGSRVVLIVNSGMFPGPAIDSMGSADETDLWIVDVLGIGSDPAS